MRFSFLTALAALGAVATAQMTSTVVVTNINTLTVKSQNLIEPAKQLSILNAPQLLLGLGPWPVCLPLCLQPIPAQVLEEFAHMEKN
jgi:hypothetical protein